MSVSSTEPEEVPRLEEEPGLPLPGISELGVLVCVSVCVSVWGEEETGLGRGRPPAGTRTVLGYNTWNGATGKWVPIQMVDWDHGRLGKGPITPPPRVSPTTPPGLGKGKKGAGEEEPTTPLGREKGKKVAAGGKQPTTPPGLGKGMKGLVGVPQSTGQLTGPTDVEIVRSQSQGRFQEIARRVRKEAEENSPASTGGDRVLLEQRTVATAEGHPSMMVAGETQPRSGPVDSSLVTARFYEALRRAAADDVQQPDAGGASTVMGPLSSSWRPEQPLVPPLVRPEGDWGAVAKKGERAPPHRRPVWNPLFCGGCRKTTDPIWIEDQVLFAQACRSNRRCKCNWVKAYTKEEAEPFILAA